MLNFGEYWEKIPHSHKVQDDLPSFFSFFGVRHTHHVGMVYSEPEEMWEVKVKKMATQKLQTASQTR